MHLRMVVAIHGREASSVAQYNLVNLEKECCTAHATCAGTQHGAIGTIVKFAFSAMATCFPANK